MRSQRLPIIVGDEIIFDVIGADPEGENDDDDSEEELEDEDLDENEEGEDDDDSDDDDDDSVESLKVKLAEEQRLRAKAEYRMKAADRAKTRAEAKLKKAGGTGDASAELAAANEKIAELQQKLDAASGQDSVALVREDFRDLADYTWHNPKVAFSMLNLDAVEVEDGKVDPESLKYAVEELAKEHPYLLKSQEDSKRESDDKSKDKRESRNPTGINPRRRKKSTDREALKKKYPSLASRG